MESILITGSLSVQSDRMRTEKRRGDGICVTMASFSVLSGWRDAGLSKWDFQSAYGLPGIDKNWSVSKDWQTVIHPESPFCNWSG